MKLSLRAVALGAIALSTASTCALTAAAASEPEPTSSTTGTTSKVAAAPGTVRRLDVLGLERGPDARIDRLQDSVITTAQGRRIRIRVPSTDGHQALLGRSGNKWLVAWAQVSRVTVSAVRRRHAPVKMPKLGGFAAHGDTYMGWWLSRSGDQVVQTYYDRGGEWYEVRSLDGKRLDDAYDAVWPLDAADGRVIAQASDEDGRVRVFDWRPAEKSMTELARRANGASIEHDLLWVRTSGISYGPTSLSAPGTPAWSAPFEPLDFSPSGRLVAGLRINPKWYDDPAVLEVRRVSDGKLLDAISFGPRITKANADRVDGHERTARWESDKQLVLELPTRRGSVLVRCRPGGRCVRAGDYGGRISVPHESFTWP